MAAMAIVVVEYDMVNVGSILDNIVGVQFHETSHRFGMQLLRNFASHDFTC